MAKKITRSRPWTKEELRILKKLARKQTKTTVIAQKLKRSVAAVYLRAVDKILAVSAWLPATEAAGAPYSCRCFSRRSHLPAASVGAPESR
jgi:hypothetical protein